MSIPSKTSEPPAPILLNGSQLETVPNYKYLGFSINDQLDCHQQLEKVQKSIGSSTYLIKNLKKGGFNQDILITVYRSLALSHFSYSAPILSMATLSMKAEMESFQSKILRIIDISKEQALTKYNIPITQHLDSVCVNILKHIIADPKHPITAKLRPINSNSRSAEKFPFIIPAGKTTAYLNSFLQKYLRSIRDDPKHGRNIVKRLITHPKEQKRSRQTQIIKEVNHPKSRHKAKSRMPEIASAKSAKDPISQLISEAKSDI
jgi:hypothetical protein